MMKKLMAAVLALVLLVPFSVNAESADYSLSGGVSPADALTLMAVIAQNSGLELDLENIRNEGGNISMDAGIFTLTVHARNSRTDSVMISAAYLDADYAQTMGYMFGQMLQAFGGSGQTDIQTILTSLDFNVFNKLAANSQVLIHNGNKIVIKVDPESPRPYQLIYATADADLTTNRQAGAADSAEEAAAILDRMGADVSAVFVYDKETDPNRKLGTPGNYTAKVNFALASLAPDAQADASVSVVQGGSIEIFENMSDAVARQYDILNKEISFLGTFEYTLICGNALLRLSPELPEDELSALVSAFVHAVNGTDVRTAGNSPDGAAGGRGTDIPMQKGDVIRLGRYEQDNDTGNGKEPIEWIVLEVSGNEALLVSACALDVYNTNWGSPTWDHSSLRTYLNGTFLQEAFTEKEQEIIIEGEVSADKNPNYTSDPGETTWDKVFALSYVQADTLLTLEQRKCEATAYAQKTRKVYTEGGVCYWWLRSPGAPGRGAAIVCTDGSYDYDYSYDGFSYGLRPAIRVDLVKLGAE